METVICGHEVYRDVSELALARSLADWRACKLTIRVTYTYITSYVHIYIYTYAYAQTHVQTRVLKL